VDQERAVRANLSLQQGQVVSVIQLPRSLSYDLKILYEDRYLIVIDKPANLLSVPLDEGEAPNALKCLQDHCHTEHIYAVHRLDREVSGVMLFARGKRSATLLSAMFREHALTRIYCAVVQGSVQEDHGKWESLLVEAESYKVYTTEDEERGARAITHYSVVRRSKNFTFMHLSLETGKKHQIRVHCSKANHPIIGDKMYGDRKCNPLSRIGLHSSQLEFVHPFTNKKMRFSAPLPAAFSKLVNFPF
jgi:tRNA pseudouridine32 synthase/23S rRNA pseudouridine746 synthase/23S rRNA pseudouridine1911/1915/1917 synthase